MPSGKWYAEATIGSGATGIFIGLWNSGNSTKDHPGSTSDSYAYWSNSGNKYNNDSNSSYGDSFTEGDIIGIAFDADGGNLYFYKNGVAQNSGTAAYTGITSRNYVFAAHKGTTGTDTRSAKWNFGQREFAFDAPSGYKALNTASMSAATIADGSEYFDILTYNGITQSPRTLTGLNIAEPDLVWVKNLDDTSAHLIWDAVRGTDNNLRSDGSFAESAVSASANGIISTSAANGFVVKNVTTGTNVGSSGTDPYVAWCWEAGTSTASNSDGSGLSNVQVRASTTAGFSIVTYTGGSSSPANSDSGDSFGHGLGVAPDVVICKKRTGTNSWPVYHRFAPTGALILDANNANDSTSFLFAKKDPTSTEVFLGNNPEINNSSHNYVAYCFAPVAGFSAFGSYTGTGSGSTAAFNYCGFRPRLVVVKRTDSTSQWSVYDTARSPNNPANKNVWWDTTEIEYTSNVYKMDIYSNGFKMRNSHSERNASGGTYVWLAFAENPFQANGGLAR